MIIWNLSFFVILLGIIYVEMSYKNKKFTYLRYKRKIFLECYMNIIFKKRKCYTI